MPQIASLFQGFWNICYPNLGDDTAEKKLNPMEIKHLPIIQQALKYNNEAIKNTILDVWHHAFGPSGPGYRQPKG